MPKLITPELDTQFDAFKRALTVADCLFTLEKVAGDGAVLSDVDTERCDLIEELGMATKFYTTRWPAVELRNVVMKLVSDREVKPQGPIDGRLLDRVRAAFQTERAQLLNQ